WFDTWKTPSAESPRRYIARFYFAQLGAHEGHEAEADGHETHAGRWASAAGHLAAWKAGEVDLPPPTLSVLLRLADHDGERWLRRPRSALSTPILPKVSALGSELAIVMPHDELYASTSGDEGPCPPRSRDYPPRYLRRENRWIPSDPASPETDEP